MSALARSSLIIVGGITVLRRRGLHHQRAASASMPATTHPAGHALAAFAFGVLRRRRAGSQSHAYRRRSATFLEVFF